MDRKKFLKTTGLTAFGGLSLLNMPKESVAYQKKKNLFFDISLAQWSLNGAYFGNSRSSGYQEFGRLLREDTDRVLQGYLDPLYFAQHARQMFNIEAIEYVNTFYFDKAENRQYINELKNVADGEGVRSVLIMCDAEGALGDPDGSARKQAIENHYKWINLAKFLGCHAIRVNAQSSGSYDEQMERAADGLRRLTEYGAQEDISVIVENHGGLSSNAQWLSSTIEMVDHPNCGTLPDFGNFRISEDEMYDYYKGTEELMPCAKGVSAKTNGFDAQGNEINLDYNRLMKIVKDAGYTGYIGIEYEGGDITEVEGIIKTKELLISSANELS